MLRCPFCETELNDTELTGGRCPGCGSVLAWQDDVPEPMPPRRLHAEEAAPSAAQLESDEPASPSNPPPSDVAVKTSQTMPVIPPQLKNLQLPPTAPPSNRETDGPKRTLVDIFALSDMPTTGGGFLSDEGTVDEQRIRETIQPRQLSPEDEQLLGDKWKATISPTSRPNMTIKTDDLGQARLSEGKTAPRRRVRDQREPNSAAADYQLLNMIGEGGVGVVYAARQTSVDRTVAVKMLRPDVMAEWEQQQKFLSEAVVTGDLDHPNIVPIYDLGSGDDGVLFYSMKRVVGTPWSDVLATKSQEENLEILMKVADAIAFAHSRGVIHRDLKPENVMLGDYGEVLVMDWGIALPTPKFQRSASILQSGSLGGTPAYMAPEMATGPISRIGTASDVYLLGGILFEMITGQTPHSGGDVMECLQAAARNEIPSTDKTGELLNIALRALATEPEDRYESVQSFQNAIREYQSHTESITLSSRAEDDLHQADQSKDYQDFARALFGFEEAYALWSGNHRAVMGISAAKLAYAQCAFEKADFDLGLSLLDETEPAHQRLRVKLQSALKDRDDRQQRLKSMKRTAAMLVVLLFVGGAYAFNLVRLAKNDALDKKLEAEGYADDLLKQKEELDRTVTKLDVQTKAATKAAKEATASATLARQQKKKAEAATTRAMVSKWREEILKLHTEYDKYLARIALAAEKINRNEFDEARNILKEYNKSDLAHWEWARLSFLTQLSQREYVCPAPVETVAFSPDGKRFVSGGQDGFVSIWKTSLQNGEKGDLLFKLTHGNQTAVNAVAWSPDGRWIVSGGEDGRVRLWNANDGAPVAAFTTGGHTEAVTSAVFSYSSKHRWLLTGSRDKSVIVWDMDRRTAAHAPLRGHSWWVWDVAITRDQSRIVTAGQDGKIILWNVSNTGGRLRIDIEQRRLSTAAAAKAQRNQLPVVLDGYHSGPVYSVAFSPDGKRVVSGGFDNRVLVWNPDKVSPVNLQARLEGKPESSPNGLQLIGHTLPVRAVQFSPDADGRLILSCSDDNTVNVWNAETGKLERTMRGHGSWVRSCAFAPIGMQLNDINPHDRLVLSGGYDHKVKLWRIAGYEEVRVYGGRVLGPKQRDEEDEVLAAVFDPPGRHIAVAGKARGVRIWNVATREMMIIRDDTLQDFREGHEYLASSIRFFQRSPHRGRRFVSGAMDGTVRVWDVDAGAEILRFSGTGSMGTIALSADEKILATGSDDHSLLLWKLPADGSTVGGPIALKGHDADVTAVAFSPNGEVLISGDTTGACLVWDVKTRKLIGPINRNAGGRRHTKQITQIGFLGNDRVATSSNDNTVVLWNLKAGTEAGRVVHDDSVTTMDVSTDRTRILTACRAASLVSTDQKKAGDSLLQIFDANGRRLAATLVRDVNVNSARFSPDGKSAIAVGNDGRLHEWSLAANRVAPLWSQETTDRDMWAAAYSPNGRQILTVGGRRVRLWDRTSGSQLMTFGAHSEVTRLGFSDDGLRLASGDSTGSVKIWNLTMRRSEQTLSHIHEGSISAVIFEPGNAGRLITVGGRSIGLWNFDNAAKQWKRISLFRGESRSAFTSAALSPDRTLFVTGAADGAVERWNLRTGKVAERFQRADGHADAVREISFSQDGKWIVTGGDDKTAIVWQHSGIHDRWVAIAHLKGHPAPVNGVSISRDRFRILTGSDDKTAKIWDARILVPGAIASINDRRVEAVQRLSESLRALEESFTANASLQRADDATTKHQIIAVLKRIHTQAAAQVGMELVEQPDRARLLKIVQTLRKRIDPDDATPDIAVDDEAKRPRDLLEVWTPAEWTALADSLDELKRLIVGPAPLPEILTLTGHVRGVTTVAFAPSGRAVLTGSRDGKSVLWPAVNIAPAIRLPAGARECLTTEAQTLVAPNAVVFDPDSTSFNTGRLHIGLTEGIGKLTFAASEESNVRVQGTTVQHRETVDQPWKDIATFATEDNGKRVTVQFNQNAGDEAVTACLQSIAWSGAKSAGQRVSVDVDLTDGNGGEAKRVSQTLVFREPAAKSESTETP